MYQLSPWNRSFAANPQAHSLSMVNAIASGCDSIEHPELGAPRYLIPGYKEIQEISFLLHNVP
jgi:hypothetical protein